jgi:hypothetical protein
MRTKLGYSMGYSRVEKNARPIAVSVHIRFRCHSLIKNHSRTPTRSGNSYSYLNCHRYGDLAGTINSPCLNHVNGLFAFCLVLPPPFAPNICLRKNKISSRKGYHGLIKGQTQPNTTPTIRVGLGPVLKPLARLDLIEFDPVWFGRVATSAHGPDHPRRSARAPSPDAATPATSLVRLPPPPQSAAGGRGGVGGGGKDEDDQGGQGDEPHGRVPQAAAQEGAQAGECHRP